MGLVAHGEGTKQGVGVLPLALCPQNSVYKNYLERCVHRTKCTILTVVSTEQGVHP